MAARPGDDRREMSAIMTQPLSPRASKRHPEILRLVREQGSCRVSDLAEQFGVTLETIRRDVAPLAESGQLVKLHGYVSLPEGLTTPSFQTRMLENPQAKQRIAAQVPPESKCRLIVS